jgi:EmrB/QacA subfamily drug resistance transporter
VPPLANRPPAPPNNHRLVALIVASASFIQQVDSTIVMTSLPQMARSLHAAPIDVGIAVSAYVLSLAVFMPVSGWLADRFGPRLVFQLAIATFTISSVLCGISQSIGEITAARLLQGIGGAMMTPVGRLLVLRGVPKAEFVSAMTWIQVPSQLGPVIGLPLGGFITTYISWRWNFLTNVPIGLLGIVMAAVFIPNEPLKERRRLDWVGFVLWGMTLALLVRGLDLIGQPNGAFYKGGLMLAAALSSGLVATLHARRQEHPLIDLSLLKVPTFAVNIHAGSLMRYGIDAMPFLLPLMFQMGFGLSAFNSGILTLASALGSVVMRAFARSILSRFGFRTVLVVNGFIAAVTIAFCGIYTATTSWAFIFITLTIGGSFRSIQLISMSTIAYADVPAANLSGATSFAGMVQQLCNAIAIAIAAIALGVLLAIRGEAAPTATDFRIALIIMSGISLLAIPLFAALPRDAGHEFSGHRGRQ